MAKRSHVPKGHRDRMLPVVAGVFAELGYRRTTTAEMARRCGVQENILYRAWPTKKAMFLAAIEYVFEASAATWRGVGEGDARALLEYEATHHGEAGLYRIVFAGLSESDDTDIRAALRGMFRKFHAFIVGRVGNEQTAWALVGLGTLSGISRQLGLMKEPERRALFERMGKALIGEKA